MSIYGLSMRRTALALVTATFLLTACGSEQPAAAPAPAPPSSPATTAGAAPQQVPDLLRFRGTTLEGAAFDGAALAGKPVLFWFWAPWCPKCQAEGPAVAKTAQRYADRLTVVGVAGLDKDKAQMVAFVERTGTGDLDHLDDRGGDLYKHFRVASQSSFLLVDATGKTASASGPLDESELSSLVEKHLR